MANFIFLDIDGVLNNQDFLLSEENDLTGWDLDPSNVKQLKKLCEECNAVVVLSSSWRRSLDDDLQILPRIKELEDARGFEGNTSHLLRTFKENNIKIVGKTDTDSKVVDHNYWDRSGQIIRYIRNHLSDEDRYVIFDDEDVVNSGLPKYRDELASHFIQTNFYGKGLCAQQVKKAKKILNKEI